MVTYDPKEEKTGGGVRPPGDYYARIKSAEKKKSASAGNTMVELNLELEDGWRVYDRLVFTPGSLFRVHNFCDAVGLDFDSGTFDEEALPGTRVHVRLAIEKSVGFPDKNKVVEYLPITVTSVREVVDGELQDDEVPFTLLLPLALSIAAMGMLA